MLGEHALIAVIGARGAVGRETLSILAASAHPGTRVRALTTDRESARTLAYGTSRIAVRACSIETLSGCDAAILCGSAEMARGLAPAALRVGALVLDHSSAFRGDATVPLVIPELGTDDLTREPRPRLVANPNCSATQLALVLGALAECAPLRRVHVATYQAVSGAGFQAIGELEEQSRSYLADAEETPRIFPEPIAFNVFPHESPESPESGLSEEETKIVEETRRILGIRCPLIAPTCVRVPVFRAHSQAINVQFSHPVNHAELTRALDNAGGVRFFRSEHPTPRRASGGNHVLAGRLRPDPAGDPCHWSLWTCVDQLRKGAALNGLQTIALMLRAHGRARLDLESTRPPATEITA